MPARTHANGRMRPSSRRLRPAMLGRQTRASTRAAAATRTNTVPPGPISSKSDFESAAPTCTEAIAITTRATGGTQG